MDIRTIECFRLVYQKKSINSAAKELFISSQGLGKMIRNLEEDLKTTLFERSTTGLIPTESADVLYDQSETLISHFLQLGQAIEQVRLKDKRLRICCARGVLNALSIRLVASFMEKYPEIDVEWKEAANSKVRQSVCSYESDIGLTVGVTEHSEINQTHLKSKKVCALIYKGHPFYKNEELSAEQLDGEKIVTLSEQYQVYHDFVNVCREKNIHPVFTGLTEDSHFLYKMCKQKIGIGIVLDFSVTDFNMKDMKLIPLKENLTWDIYMIYAKKNSSYPNISLFESHIKELYR